jgi:hypothetical protein
MWRYAEGVTRWTNASLAPPPPHVVELLSAAGADKAVADALVDAYDDPPAMWRALATPERAATFLARTRSAVAA